MVFNIKLVLKDCSSTSKDVLFSLALLMVALKARCWIEIVFCAWPFPSPFFIQSNLLSTGSVPAVADDDDEVGRKCKAFFAAWHAAFDDVIEKMEKS